ncbi:MAG: recombination mediator RecR [Methylocystaceae bacterium]
MRLARPLETMIDELGKLPGIGPKTAQRLALYIMKLPTEEVTALARALTTAKEKVFACSRCGNLTDSDPCLICRDESRNRQLVCVVEEASDVIAMERAGFEGVYSVLAPRASGGDILSTFNPDELVEQLVRRGATEVLMATNPDLQGEVLARMLAEGARRRGLTITRLAHGLPVGGDIEFADEITLRQAIKGRKEI